VAVSGAAVPWNDLHQNSWRTQEAQQATITMASYREYLQASLGEFSVCKNVFVTLNTGWFSDRSAAYLASGRPVVLQDTGFSQHLPTGEGLFAVKDVDEAAEAIDTITKSYPRHSKAARNLALEFLSPLYIRSNLLENIGL
jgi:glycosyltransferase involved in cell wall biosynthesis